MDISKTALLNHWEDNDDGDALGGYSVCGLYVICWDSIQAFIQVLLSTSAFSQRFSFFTVCLVQWLVQWGDRMIDTKGKMFGI